MKNKAIGIIGIIIATLLILVGCRRIELAKPTNLSINHTIGTLSWDVVDDADYYLIDTGGKKYKEAKSEFKLDKLPLGDYEIRVQALDDNKNESEWSDSIHYSKTEASLLSLKLFNSNKEYEVVGLGIGASGDIVIPGEFNGIPITKIGESAFEGYASIKTVTLGANIVEIGANAFKGATELEGVSLNDGLLKIGESAFEGCLSLTSIVMPNSVVEVKDKAFAYNKSLESAVISESLKVIPNSMMTDAVKLKSLNIPRGVVEIKDYAFSRAISLTNLILGNTLDKIGSYAFYEAKSLKEVEIPGSVKEIGEFSFMGNESLAMVRINEGTERILKQAFYKDSSLSTVYLPESLSYIGDYAFYETKIYNDSENETYIGSWLIAIKKGSEVINLKPGITGIANLAIKELDTVFEIILPETLKYIGSYNIYKLENLTKLTINGDSLLEIGSYSFFDCPGLLVTELPDSVTRIGDKAFNKTLSFTVATDIVTVGDWVVGHKNPQTLEVRLLGYRGIADYAFMNFRSLQGVRLGNDMKYIGEGAFSGCSALKSIELNEGLLEIGAYAFSNASALDNIAIPSTIKVIKQSTFYRTSRLKSISFKEGLEKIEDYAFYESGIIRLNLPNSLISIGSSAFYSITPLQLISFGENLKEIGDYAFFKAISLDELALPNSLEKIGNHAFYGAIKLTSLKLGDKLKVVDSYAFYGAVALRSLDLNKVEEIKSYAFSKASALESLILPSSLKSIGAYAFIGAKKLKSLYIPSNILYIGEHAFQDNNELSIYLEGNADGFSSSFNSAYRPLIKNVTMSEDKSYLVGFTMSEANALNLSAINGLEPPFREGYKFIGWSKSKDSSEIYLNIAQTRDIPNGTTVYAIYEKAV